VRLDLCVFKLLLRTSKAMYVPPQPLIEVFPDSLEAVRELLEIQPLNGTHVYSFKQVCYKNPFTDQVFCYRQDIMFNGYLLSKSNLTEWGVLDISKETYEEYYTLEARAYGYWREKCLSA
jgi:hypothetical protein